MTFRIQLPNSSGGPYGPFFYQLTAIEDNVTLAVIQGQQYTGKFNTCVYNRNAAIGNSEVYKTAMSKFLKDTVFMLIKLLKCKI